MKFQDAPYQEPKQPKHRQRRRATDKPATRRHDYRRRKEDRQSKPRSYIGQLVWAYIILQVIFFGFVALLDTL